MYRPHVQISGPQPPLRINEASAEIPPPGHPVCHLEHPPVQSSHIRFIHVLDPAFGPELFGLAAAAGNDTQRRIVHDCEGGVVSCQVGEERCDVGIRRGRREVELEGFGDGAVRYSAS
jgi:hypothetical protein